MKELKYAIVALIDGQEFTSKNNTHDEFKKLVDMVRYFGGSVVEHTAYEEY